MSASLSVVIPVYNSADVVDETIDRTLAFLDRFGEEYELILVNDGSRDRSWEVIRARAEAHERITAIDLLRNHGQHSALLCGLARSTGEYVVTMDDDLQNPPEEIAALCAKAREGHDLVFGRFRQKQHPLYRRLGSLLIGAVNRRIFRKPAHLVASNFRLIRRDVVYRIVNYQTSCPYITGLALIFSASPANADVEHRQRPRGTSQYNLVKIIELVMRILFNYSSYPLRLVSAFGAAIAGASFLVGLYHLVDGLLGGVPVPGWTTLVVLCSFLNGIVILILSMLGEYTVRLLNQTSSSSCYQVREIVGSSAVDPAE